MCGIAGIVWRGRHGDQSEDARRVSASLQQLRRRGPDDEGVWQSRGVVIGHRRLSILDLSACGHQPMLTGDGRYVCTLNGEIYNYLELRAELAGYGHAFRTGTDTEVLLAAFAEWGTRCLTRLRGQFAFAIWDNEARRLWLARDRIGEKPLHFWRDGGRFAFASEIKALLELLPARPALVPDSVNAYLHYQYVVEPRTLLDGVEKLPAGHVLEVAPDRLDATPAAYWSFADVAPATGEPIATLGGALDRAVELTLRSDAPVGLALSGGLDSSVIAALAARRRPDLMAFSVGYPGARAFDERAPARDLAKTLGLQWVSDEISTSEFVDFFPSMVELVDEPIADPAAYAIYRVSRLASQHGVKVLLTGIGGDELFFGYSWVREALRLSTMKLAWRHAAPLGRAYARMLRALVMRTPALRVAANRRLPAWWRQRADRAFDPGKIDLDRPDEWVFYQLDYHWEPAAAFTSQLFADDFRRRLSPRGAHRFMAGLERGDVEISILRLLFQSWLVSNCLDLGDRVSMASSVETRVPLLDTEVVETALGFWKAGRGEEALGHKTWLRTIARDLLPPDVLGRPKLGFITPTVEWTRAVNTRYRTYLEDGALVRAGVLDRERLRQWLDRTRAGVHREVFQYKLTLLELWHRIVLDRERPESLA